jgi:hypothetical protein
MDCGTILALLVSTQINRLGWKYVYLVFGCLAAVWVGFFALFGSSAPEADKYITAREKTHIVSTYEMDSSFSLSLPFLLGG